VDVFVKDERPINLDIGHFRWPLAALTSITHRISGVIVFIGIAILLWMFDKSLTSEADFNSLKETLELPFFKFIVWGTLSALTYHLVAGVKHLILDMGIGETKQGSTTGATITIIVSVLLIISLGVWLW
jgi:succinate dehydrogenase / fumarate reductase, cytochrome b subunit